MIICTDEKWFILCSHLNRQNCRYQSVTNPYQYDDSVKQGAEKVMCWAAIVDGPVSRLVWFEEGESVNGQGYLDLLQQSFWPEVRHKATRREYWNQQDGAPCHCSNECLNSFSKNK